MWRRIPFAPSPAPSRLDKLFKSFDDLLQDVFGIGIPQRTIEDFHFDRSGVAGLLHKEAQLAVIDYAVPHKSDLMTCFKTSSGSESHSARLKISTSIGPV